MQEGQKKIIILLIICIITINFSFLYLYVQKTNATSGAMQSTQNIEQKIVTATDSGIRPYEVYQNNYIIEIFNTYEEALAYAEQFENASIKQTGEYKWIWDNNPPYEVYQNYTMLKQFIDYKEALEYAKSYANSSIFYRESNTFIWGGSQVNIPDSYVIPYVPRISQYPELPRGCEVTSVTMLMNYIGLPVSKMELAEKIQKEPFIFTLDGKEYNGNPHIGFVGDMYSVNNPGYGAYNEPIYQLMDSYQEGRAINLTEVDFKDLYYYINQNRPVVVIINTTFDVLPESQFEIFHTTRGDIPMTYREHSVLIIGYDEEYIYFNDPMYPDEVQKKQKNKFIKAWEQMGSQALTFVP